MEIKNLDALKQQFKAPKNRLSIYHPSRVLLVGSSGCGKTNLLGNLLLNPDLSDWDRIYFYSTTNGSLTELLEQIDSNYFDLMGEHCVIFGDSNFVKVSEINSELKNVVVFDDHLMSGKSVNQEIADFFVRGRHSNITCYYLAQDYYSVPAIIRRNVNYIILFKLNGKREMDMICHDINLGNFNNKLFQRFYSECVKEPYSFMVVDKRTKNELLKFRKRFDNIPKIHGDSISFHPIRILKRGRKWIYQLDNV
jgi:hypothetical protein